ncbi:LysM peptidoglycan-binding domain-containing protein [Arenimonas sp.]|uniref:LysM peptidoglycan-binding domain-containing protein n=1 Tax=Arenimonas sp. TaxID=1872635 RepID=UPI0039C8564E
MLKRLLAVFTAMLLTLATFAFAAELRGDHPSTYTVRKGDTLWDISARFLNKPWLWPEIWQANPQVKNPHRIYPGDVLSLVYIDGRPTLTGPEIHSGEPIETIPLSEVEPFLKQLSVVNDVESLPYVIGLEEDRLLTTSGQLVYVRNLAGAQVGQQVQIARPVNVFANGVSPLNYRGVRFHSHWAYTDPGLTKQEAHGTKLGFEMMAQANGQVTQVNGDVASVLLQDEGREVRVGDRILPLAPPYDAQFYPQAPASIPAGAHIMAVADGITAGPQVVVALSVGANDGIKNGTTFSIWHPGAHIADRVAHRNVLSAKADKVTMPDEFNSHVMVFRTFDKVSYGLIMDGIRPAHVGDVLKHPDATQ